MPHLSEQTQYKVLRVGEGGTKLTTTHNGQDLTFLHPVYGPGTYANVGLGIEKAGLKKPTMAETASLVHAAFNSDDRYSSEIKDIMENAWLWAFTGTLYAPQGAYIQDNPEIRNGMPFMEESELVKKLEANDPSVRFVQFGYPTGDMISLELAKNDYVIALAGKEGAEKLAQVADKHRNNPYLWSFESVENPQTRVSALYSWLLNHRLGVYGNYLHGNLRNGRAFGVSENTGGASRAEK